MVVNTGRYHLLSSDVPLVLYSCSGLFTHFRHQAKHEQERAQMVRDGLLRETTRATGVKSQLGGAPKVPFPVHEAFEVAPGEGSAAGGDGKPTQQ